MKTDMRIQIKSAMELFSNLSAWQKEFDMVMERELTLHDKQNITHR